MIITHGWHGFYALRCLYEDELHKKKTEAYIAEHLWLLTSAMYAFGGNKLDTPRYTEILKPELKNTDTRTAYEVISDIRNKL